MSSYTDNEFGEIVIHKRKGAKSVRIRVGTDGRYLVSAPLYTPLFYIKQVVNSSREQLRKLAINSSVENPYTEGQVIGQSHTLAVVQTQMVAEPQVKTERKRLIVYLPPDHELSETAIQQQIRDEVVKILRREAKAYLPGRLNQIAQAHGFRYERVRFSHAGGRWGSCSSTGTISLNIALMKLTPVLIDYVLIHELSHTRQMNHSPAFWREVEQLDPLYKLHRQQIKRETPTV